MQVPGGRQTALAQQEFDDLGDALHHGAPAMMRGTTPVPRIAFQNLGVGTDMRRKIGLFTTSRSARPTRPALRGMS